MRNINFEIEKHLVLELRGITFALQRLNEFYEEQRLALPLILPDVVDEDAGSSLEPRRGGFEQDYTTDDS